LPLADIAHEHARAALAKERGELDWGALITVVRELAGLPSARHHKSPGQETRLNE